MLRKDIKNEVRAQLKKEYPNWFPSRKPGFNEVWYRALYLIFQF